MMKRYAAMTATALGLLAATPAMSFGLFPKDPSPPPGGTTPPKVSAPEIDVAAGAKGIALLVLAVSLVAESRRRRRSSTSPDT